MFTVYEVLPIPTSENLWDFLLIKDSPNMLPCHFTIKCWCFQYSHSASIQTLNYHGQSSDWIHSVTNDIISKYATFIEFVVVRSYSAHLFKALRLLINILKRWKTLWETLNPDKAMRIYSASPGELLLLLLDITHLFEDFLFVFAELLIFQFPLAEFCLQSLDALIQRELVSVWWDTDTPRI